jgi:hypothetical protein
MSDFHACSTPCPSADGPASARPNTRPSARVSRAIACFREHLAPGGVIVIEPWFPPGALDTRRVARNTGNANGVRVTRISRVEVEGRVSRLHFDYEITDATGTRRASEIHELGLHRGMDADVSGRRARRRPRSEGSVRSRSVRGARRGLMFASGVDERTESAEDHAMRLNMRASIALLVALVVSPVALQAQKPRERDLKLPIGGTPGALDAITDVAGVEVGQTTLISGSGKLVVGKGPVRTGVTVIHPRGKANADPVFAAWFTLNGNGEMTGTTWVQESGLLEGPVAITNTHSVGVVRDAIIQWEVSQKNALQPWWLPVVAETYDGGLNDINGFHVKEEHVSR